MIAVIRENLSPSPLDKLLMLCEINIYGKMARGLFYIVMPRLSHAAAVDGFMVPASC